VDIQIRLAGEALTWLSTGTVIRHLPSVRSGTSKFRFILFSYNMIFALKLTYLCDRRIAGTGNCFGAGHINPANCHFEDIFWRPVGPAGGRSDDPGDAPCYLLSANRYVRSFGKMLLTMGVNGVNGGKLAKFRSKNCRNLRFSKKFPCVGKTREVDGECGCPCFFPDDTANGADRTSRL